MHPLSPHAPSTFARHGAAVPPAPVRGRTYGKGTLATPKGRMSLVADPLDGLAAEIRAKVTALGVTQRAHVAAEQLKVRRPRRPAASRASFRTPPAS